MQVNKLYRIEGFNVQAGYQESPAEVVLQSSSIMKMIERENFPEVIYDFKGLEELHGVSDNMNVGKFSSSNKSWN